jgi:hypothetical protein
VRKSRISTEFNFISYYTAEHWHMNSEIHSLAILTCRQQNRMAPFLGIRLLVTKFHIK